jgi:asparagine synthase (glutamine-hydrolysing)
MDASLESRLPFLLPELVTFLLSLPDQHLLGQDGESKLVLRRAVADLVPAAVLDRRRKVGLSVPLLSWARSIPDVASRLEEMQDTDVVSKAWLRPRLSALRGDSRIDSTDLFILWRLVGFSLWREALGVASV